MADTIQSSDLFADPSFSQLKQGAQSFLKDLQNITANIRENLQASREFINTWKAVSVTSLNELNAKIKEAKFAIDALNKAEKEEIKIREALAKAEKAEAQAKKAKIQADAEYQKQVERSIKAQQKQLNEFRKANSVYEQSKKQLNDISKALIELELRGRGGGKTAEKLRKEFEKLNEKVRNAEQSVGRFQRNVGNYPNLEGLTKNIGALKNAFFGLAGIGGGVAIFKSAIDGIAEFDQSLADLRSITGLTANSSEFKFLEEQSLRLGTTTTASAVQVVEAYKLIASAKPELLENVTALNQVTKAAITLSEASGLELPDAATRLTDAMNQFGASANEAAYYMDVLANGAKYGSAEISEVTDALLKFGVAAKSSNISIEESVGLIEAFAEKGLKGAEAGTSLRNILLKLSAAKALPKEALVQLDKAGVDINKLSDSSLSLEERLNELAKIQGNATAIVKVFGTENAVQAQTLIENRDRVAELTGKMGEYGTASEQAKERTDTVNGELTKLANTWQAAVIRFGQGGGSIKNAIKFIRENLETIIEVVINVTQAFIAYKAAVMAVNTAYKAKDIVNYIMNLGKVKKGLEQAEAAQLATNRAMKANVIGLVVSGLVTLIDQLDLFKSAADLAAESQERINSAMEKSLQGFNDVEEMFRKNIASIEQYYDLQIKRSKDVDKKKELELEKEKKINEAYAGRIESSKQEINQIDASIKKLEELSKQYGSMADDRSLLGKALKADLKIDNDLSINENLKSLKKLKTEREDYQKSLETESQINILDTQEKNFAAEVEAIEKLENKKKEAREKAKQAREKEYQDLIKEFERERDLELTAIERTTETEERKRELRLNAEKDFLEKKLAIDNVYNKEFEKTELELVRKRIEIQNIEIEARKKLNEMLIELQRQFDESEVKATEDKFERERLEAMRSFENVIEGLDKERKAIQENSQITYEERKKALEQLDQLETNAKKELIKKLDGINSEQSDENFNAELQNYKDYYDFLELQALKSGKTREEIEKELQKQRIEALKDEIKLRQEYGKQTIDQEKELAALENDIREERKEKNIESIKEFSSRAIELVQEEINRERELRGQQLDKEISERQSNIDRQRELAEKGLQNTLAFEQAALAKAELEKAQLARKEIKDQEKITFLKLLQGYATEGKASEAVRRALTDIALSRVISGAFYEGTERVSDDLGQPTFSGRDGYVIRVDGKERVMTGAQNEMVGDMTNDELAKLAYNYNTGKLMPEYATPVYTFGRPDTEQNTYTLVLAKKVDTLNANVERMIEIVRDRPVISPGFNQFGEYVETEIRRGMKTITTHFKQNKRPRI